MYEVLLGIPGLPSHPNTNSANSDVAGAVATKDLLFIGGTTPSVNGTVPEGIEAQAVSSILPKMQYPSLLTPFLDRCDQQHCRYS